MDLICNGKNKIILIAIGVLEKRLEDFLSVYNKDTRKVEYVRNDKIKNDNDARQELDKIGRWVRSHALPIKQELENLFNAYEDAKNKSANLINDISTKERKEIAPKLMAIEYPIEQKNQPFKKEAMDSSLEDKTKKEEKPQQNQTQKSKQPGLDLQRALTLFDLNLIKIQKKSKQLEARGYLEESKIAEALFNDLTQQRNNFDINNASHFTKNCDNLIKTAQEGKLKKLRGCFNRIWHNFSAALNFIKTGTFDIKITDSIRIITEMKNSLNTFKEISDKPQADKTQDDSMSTNYVGMGKK